MVVDCSECGSSNTIKYGKRSMKNGSKPVFYCNGCGSKFVEPGFKDKSYSGKVILEALKYYALGYSLEQSSKNVNKRFKVKTSRNTVYNWVREYRDICKILADRDKYTEGFEPETIITEHSYVHSGLEYPYRVHNKKLELAEEYGFDGLAEFLNSLDSEIDHSIFEKCARSSQVEHGKEKRSYQAEEDVLSCRIADLALKANNNRRKRHDSVQDLMLKTDKATVATEVPVWYYDKKLEDTITGHIDILQTRNNKVHILDYKPKAEKVEPVSQLTSYVKALSYRTGIPRDKFKAAWFDEEVYRVLF